MNLFDAIFSKASLSETAVLSEHRSITYADLREQTLGFASILSSFDLPLIGRYFPEYEQEIRTRLRRIK